MFKHSRTLRSQELRDALWLAADGKCQLCFIELGDEWEADHVKPWSETRRTNVHEMQALCRPCNRKKGEKTMQLRRHQKEAYRLAAEQEFERNKKRTVVAAITPGGGKTLAAALYANKLIDIGLVDRVLWVSPRSSLAVQVAKEFYRPEFGCNRKIRKAVNTKYELVKGDGVVGYATTYQAIAARPLIHAHEVERHRYLIILDEPHHLAEVEEGRKWVSALRPLVEASAYHFFMTGTIARHDGEKIPFIPYEPVSGKPDCFAPVIDIQYSRGVALNEQAILPIYFKWQDGVAKYQDGTAELTVGVSVAEEDQQSKALRTALASAEYRNNLIKIGLDDWVKSCTHSPSRAIVICDKQDMARKVKTYIEKNYSKVALAISDEPDAQKVINNFRDRLDENKILVTVGMAYEGLDVPDCTHLVVLTATRSVSWLEQAFARVTRVDYKCGVPYSAQWAHIYVPDDKKMQDVVAEMKRVQAGEVRERERQEREAGDRTDRPENTFFPLSAEVGQIRYGNVDDGQLSDEHNIRVTNVYKKYPHLTFIPGVMMHDIMYGGFTPSTPPAARDEKTILERETELRAAIEDMARKLDSRDHSLEWGTTNKNIKQKFKKAREAMSVQELEAVFEYLQQRWAAAA